MPLQTPTESEFTRRRRAQLLVERLRAVGRVAPLNFAPQRDAVRRVIRFPVPVVVPVIPLPIRTANPDEAA